MTKQEAQLIEEFAKLKLKQTTIVAKVTKINDNLTIAADDDGVEYDDIRLRAIVDTNDNGFYMIPAVGSTVLLSFVGTSRYDCYVSMYSVVDKMILKIGENRILIEKDTAYLNFKSIVAGEESKSEKAVKGESLNALLKDMLSHMSKVLTVLQSFGTAQTSAASGTLAPLAAAYSVLAQQTAQELGTVNQIQTKLQNHLSKNVKLS